MVIKPGPHASRRTHTRIKEHGPEFEVVKHMHIQAFPGQGVFVFLRAPDGWFGWLPLEELVQIPSE